MTQVARRHVHTRSIRVEAYRREDELWDLEARIQDVKQKDVTLMHGVRPAGTPFHDMQLTITIDQQMNVVAVKAQTNAAPFPGECETFPEVYQRLVGLNLMQGFRNAVRERVGGKQGCTHLTELTDVLPTVAFQAFAGEVVRMAQGEGKPNMPPHLDRCRAWRLEGPVVAKLYPRWHRAQGENE